MSSGTRMIVGAALAGSILLAAPPTAESQSAVVGHRSYSEGPIKNFSVVWAHKLTRSAMPLNDAGWAWLRSQGVRSIVTFRNDSDFDYPKRGFTDVLRLPLTNHIFPTDQQAERFLAFIQDPVHQPVHMHCEAGRDRTGMMTALARYAVDGWPLEKALAEASLFRKGKPLHDNRIEWLQAWAARHPPGSARLEREVGKR